MTPGQICPPDHDALLPSELSRVGRSTVAVLKMSIQDDSHIPLQLLLNISMQGKLQRFNRA